MGLLDETYDQKETLQTKDIEGRTSAQDLTGSGNRTWTQQLLLFQMAQLKMGYRRKTQKMTTAPP